MDIISFIKESKYRELCLAVSYAVRPSVSAFRNRLRGYFSQQQKEVIKNIKSDNISLGYFYELDKYIEKFIKIYMDSVLPSLNKGIKRGEIESDIEATEDVKMLLQQKYVEDMAKFYITKIENTTIDKLNSFYKDYIAGKITKEEFIQKVNNYYNSDCKGWRSKEIALTESYRAFNWAYYTYMVMQGYVYKKYIACFNLPDSKSKYLHGQVKFYLEPFCLPYDVIRGGDNCSLIPPLHPNSRATIIMLKENNT